MARQQENGRQWFKFPVDFFADRNIKIMRSQLGYGGIIVYEYLLCQIYHEGYYTVVDNDFIALTADELKLKDNIIRLTINFCLKKSMFDSTLYQTEKVLTSAEIQDRYQKMMKSLNRKVPVDKKLWVLDEKETESFIQFYSIEDKSEIKNDKSVINRDKSEIYSVDKKKEDQTIKEKTKEQSQSSCS